jgi:hypothetical protein
MGHSGGGLAGEASGWAAQVVARLLALRPLTTLWVNHVIRTADCRPLARDLEAAIMLARLWSPRA